MRRVGDDVHLGAQTLVLVGCDANYTSTAGSYFYADGKHTSRTTEAGQLIGTWGESGSGQYGYHRTAEELAAGGRRLLDATVGGSLTVLEKIALTDVPALAAGPGLGRAAEPEVGLAPAGREVVHSNGD